MIVMNLILSQSAFGLFVHGHVRWFLVIESQKPVEVTNFEQGLRIPLKLGSKHTFFSKVRAKKQQSALHAASLNSQSTQCLASQHPRATLTTVLNQHRPSFQIGL